jgi:hypothetical protein
MARRFFFGIFAIAIALAAGQAALAQTTWDQYRAQLERNREMQARRYDQWREQQEKTYQERRAAEAANPGYRVDLRDPSIPPGNYVIRLPFGLSARVNVQPRDGAPPPPAWSGSYLAQVVSLSRRISDDLRDIRYGVHQTNHDRLKRLADEALSGVNEVQRLALERGDAAQIRQEFQDFDQNWHQLVNDLANQNYLHAGWIRQKAENITQNDQALHQLLRIGEARVYDRLRVAALTRQLSDSVEHLLEDVQFEDRENPQMEVVGRRVERVRRLAADLEQSVAQDAPFATIVEEYQEFDHAWHRLLAVARELPDVDRHLAQAARQVRGIDVELHRELRVAPPTIADPLQMRNLAESIARQAEHLAEDLRASVADRDRDILRMADDFTWAAQNLQRALTETQRSEGDAAQGMQRYWSTLYRRVQQLSGERSRHARDMAAALDEDVQRLLVMIQERP